MSTESIKKVLGGLSQTNIKKIATILRVLVDHFELCVEQRFKDYYNIPLLKFFAQDIDYQDIRAATKRLFPNGEGIFIQNDKISTDLENRLKLPSVISPEEEDGWYIRAMYGFCGITNRRQLEENLIFRANPEIIKETKLAVDNFLKSNTDLSPQKFKLPSGTQWKNFIIKLINLENVFFRVRGREIRKHYSEIDGFTDQRNDKFNEQWKFLLVLAANNGDLGNNSPDFDRKYKKIKERLTNILQSYFGIPDDPFFSYELINREKPKKSYKTRFTLFGVNKKDLIGGLPDESDDLGLKKFYEEQTPNK